MVSGFFKTAQTRINIPRNHRRIKPKTARKVFAAGRAQGAGNPLKGRGLIRGYVAEYKTIGGDIFTLRFPFEASEYTIRPLKECFRVESPERQERLATLQKLGLTYPIEMVCDACDSERAKCRGCRLFKGLQQPAGPKGERACAKRQN